MSGDFWALYGLSVDDVQKSPGMVRVFYELLERIAYEPFSLYRAQRLGGDYWFGWTTENDVLASIVEELRGNTLTVASVGGGKGIPRKIEVYQDRPQVKAKRPRTLKEAMAHIKSL